MEPQGADMNRTRRHERHRQDALRSYIRRHGVKRVEPKRAPRTPSYEDHPPRSLSDQLDNTDWASARARLRDRSVFSQADGKGCNKAPTTSHTCASTGGNPGTDGQARQALSPEAGSRQAGSGGPVVRVASRGRTRSGRDGEREPGVW